MSMSMTLQAVEATRLERFLAHELPFDELAAEQRLNLEDAWDVLLHLIGKCPVPAPYQAQLFLEGESRPDAPLDACIVLRQPDLNYACQVFDAISREVFSAQFHSAEFAALDDEALYRLAFWRDPDANCCESLYAMLNELRALFATAAARKLPVLLYMH